MTFISPDVIDDETAVAEAILAGVADRIDLFSTSEGHLEAPISEAVGVTIATAITTLKDTVLDAYVGFGQRILRIPRGAAGVAACVSTWTVTPNALPVIPAGTEVDLTLPDGSTTTFAVNGDVPVPADTTTITGVALTAEDAGPDSNDATNPASSNVLVGVLAVSIDAPAAGGSDAEDPDAYADRTADRAQRLHTLPITPDDYAAFALDLPVVARAVAINRFNPATPTVDAAGHLTLIVVDAAGAALDPADKQSVVDYFASIERPLSYAIHIADPVDVPVTPAATIRAGANVDRADLQARAQAAITDKLDPATFDADSSAPGGWARVRSSELTVFDISAAIDDLDGLVAVTDVTLNGSTDPVPLPAPVSIPQLTGTPVVTVV